MLSQLIYKQLPPMPKGYPLGDYVSVIIPEASVNLIANPSLERGITGYTASNGAAILQAYNRQAYGAASLMVVVSSHVNSGTYYEVALEAGDVYTFSVDVFASQGVPMRITIATAAGAILAQTEFRGQGRFVRHAVSATPTTTATHRLYVEKNNSTSERLVYIDGVQLENKAYPTTYFDGSFQGFISTRADFYWNGAPHASISTRSAQTRAGGRLVNLSYYGFTLMTILGLGMAPVANVATPAGLLGGAYYQRSVPESRNFTLLGDMRNGSPAQLERDQTALVNVLRYDLVSPSQPLVLRYQDTDDCGAPTGIELDIQCHHQGPGPGNSFDNLHGESTALNFTQFLPLISATLSSGVELDFTTEVDDANYIQQRNADGQWAGFGVGADQVVYAALWGPDGKLYITGSFTSIAGVAANYIAVYDPVTGVWAPLSTGLSGGGGIALAFGPDGALYVTGDFTLAGGVANTVRLARWLNGVWTPVSTGLSSGTGYALAFGPDGALYVGGSFGLAGGIAGTVRVAKYTVAGGFEALDGGANGDVRSLAFNAAGLLAAGGNFSTFGGVAAAFIATWDGSAASALSGGGMDAIVYAVLFGPDQNLYVAGNFDFAGGIPASKIAVSNLVGWQNLGTGLNNFGYALAFDATGTLHVGGAFTAAGGIVSTGLARWTGSSWISTDTTIGGIVNTIAISPDQTMVFGTTASGAGTAAGVTPVTVGGNADSYPSVEFVGPGTLVQLVNETTEKGIYFDLTLLAGERAVLTLQPDNISFVSTFRGDISGAILPGSQEASFALQAGIQNLISVFMTGTDSDTAAIMTWHNAYSSVQAATP